MKTHLASTVCALLLVPAVLVRAGTLPEGGDTPLAGTYDAYLYAAEPWDGADLPEAVTNSRLLSVYGLLTLTVSTAGRLSAKLTTQAGRTSVSHKMNAGDTTFNLGKSGWDINLGFTGTRLHGSVQTPGGAVFEIDGCHRRFAVKSDTEAKTLLAQFARYYTAQLMPPFSGTTDPLPAGCGYLTLNVNTRTGSTRIAGKLADGTSVSQSTLLLPHTACGASAAVPFFVPLYNSKGSVSGLLGFEPAESAGRVNLATDTGAGWYFRWENTKPGGHLGYINAFGCDYNPATAKLHPYGYVFAAFPGDIPWHEPKAATPSGVLYWDALVSGLPVSVTHHGTRLSMPRGAAPKSHHGHHSYGYHTYDHHTVSSARATLRANLRTGIYSGCFYGHLNVPHHKTHAPRLRQSRATCAGIMMQAADNFLVLGSGFATVPATEPAAKKLRLCHSLPVILNQGAEPPATENFWREHQHGCTHHHLR